MISSEKWQLSESDLNKKTNLAIKCLADLLFVSLWPSASAKKPIYSPLTNLDTGILLNFESSKNNILLHDK